MNLSQYRAVFLGTEPGRTIKSNIKSIVRTRSTQALLLGLAACGLMGCVVFSLFMPALFVFLWLMLMAFIPKNPKVSIALSALNVIFIFGWMNIQKVPINDWHWYTTHYKWLEEMPLNQYLGTVFNGMTIKVTEPVYHTISWITSRLTSGYVPALAIVVTTIIYGSVATGIAIFIGRHLKSPFEAILITWIPLTVGITFTLTAQLVRQEIAASFLFLAMATLWTHRIRTSVALVGLAILTHNSSFFPALCLIACAHMVNAGIPAKYRIPLAAIIGGALGGALILSPSGENYYISQQNDGSISLSIYILDTLLFLTLLVVRRYIPDLRKLSSALITSLVGYVFFIAAVAAAPLLLLRMYFYMEFFRAAVLMLIAMAVFQSRHALLLGIPALLTAFIYVEARLLTSPFFYFGGLTAHLLRPFAFF